MRVSDGLKTNITKGLGVMFQSETDDRPEHPTPYGQAGWTDGDNTVLLYDRYDIWEVHPDGRAPRMLTAGLGRKQQIVFRYSPHRAGSAGEPGTGGGSRARAVRPTSRRSRRRVRCCCRPSTSARRRAGCIACRSPAAPSRPKLVMLDKAFGVPIKARNADVYVFTLSRFEEFGNLWASSGAFTDMKKVSDANPQQAQYNWGTSELDRLRQRRRQAPAGDPHEAGELRSVEEIPDARLHLRAAHQQPASLCRAGAGGSSINVTRYVSNGYIILQPDIVYDLGYPGQSALKCVLPAVQKVLTMGFVDPARVGIQGHSWGGYQISYMITKTNIFRAVEAGASVGDMFGGYGGIRWGTGMSRAFQYEKTQSRIGVPPWKNPLIYMENSPLFWIENIHTPYLTMANDEDDAVPWQQGIEFFTAMRRLGKEAYMFVYNGEKHGLRQRENQKHWTVHMAEYFDYFFKDAPEAGLDGARRAVPGQGQARRVGVLQEELGWWIAMKKLLFLAAGAAAFVVHGSGPAVVAQAPRAGMSALPSFAEPGISPDGSTIAFVSGGDIWEVPARGGDARLLVSHPATESRPLFSPDGKRLAFTSTRTGNGDVYVLALASGDVTRLTFDDANELVSGWSADSQSVLFQSNSHEISGMLDVYRVGVDGGTPMPVAADRYTTEYFAAPSPGGESVAITARANAGSQWWRKGHSHLDESEIWIVRPAAAGGRPALRTDHARRREGRVADVGRRRQGSVLHVRPQRRAEHLGDLQPRRAGRHPGRREGGDDVHGRPRAVAVDLEGRPDDRLRARFRHLDGRHRERPGARSGRSRCAARRRRRASSTARSAISCRSWRSRRTARRSRSRSTARCSRCRPRTAATRCA